MNSTRNSEAGLPAKEFESVFRKAGVLVDGLDSAKSSAAKAVRIGKFLTPNIGREVRINVSGRSGRAKLCVREGRPRTKLYYFEVRWDASTGDSGAASGNTDAALDDGVDTRADATVPEGEEATQTPGTSTAGPADREAGGGEGNDEQW